MKRALNEAIKAGDVVKARSLLLDALRRSPGNKETIINIRTVMLELPDLFDKEEDVLFTLPAEDWNDAYSRTLERQLMTHFTSDRFSHFTEVVVELERRRQAGEATDAAPARSEEYADVEVDVRPAGFTELVAVEEVVDLSETISRNADKPQKPANAKNERNKIVSIAGYVLMALGAAAAITGMFVPAHFIIGIGIGVFMLGTAVCYMAISRHS